MSLIDYVKKFFIICSFYSVVVILSGCSNEVKQEKSYFVNDNTIDSCDHYLVYLHCMNKRANWGLEKVQTIIDELHQTPNSREKKIMCSRNIDAIHNNKELITLTYELWCLIPPITSNSFESTHDCNIKWNIDFHSSYSFK